MFRQYAEVSLTRTWKQYNLHPVLPCGAVPIDPLRPAPSQVPSVPNCAVHIGPWHQRSLIHSQTVQDFVLEPGQHLFTRQLLSYRHLCEAVDPKKTKESPPHHDSDLKSGFFKKNSECTLFLARLSEVCEGKSFVANAQRLIAKNDLERLYFFYGAFTSHCLSWLTFPTIIFKIPLNNTFSVVSLFERPWSFLR